MKQHYLLLLSFFTTSLFVYSQKSKLFYDAFGLQGKVNYTGAWVDSAMPKNGNYNIKWRTLHNNNICTYNASGNINNSLLNGKWQWEQAFWDYTIEPGKTIAPNFNLRGEKHLWNANFKDGKAHGSWKFVVDSIPATNKLQKENLQITSTYQNGILTGVFNVNDNRTPNNFSAKGECDKFGQATGIWQFNYTTPTIKLTETRTYESGLLLEVKSIKIEGKDTLIKLKIIDGVKEKLNLLKQNKEPLTFKIGDENFETDGYETEIKKTFLNYFESYTLNGWRLPVFNAVFKRNSLVFKKIQYPLSNEETALVQKLKSKTDSLNTHIQKRILYQNIILNRSRSANLDIAVAFTEMASHKIKQIDSLLTQSQLPLFTYVNRFNSQAINWASILNTDSFARANYYSEQAVQFPQFNFQTSKNGVFTALYKYLQQIDSSSKTHLLEMDQSYQKLQKEGELLLLENTLANHLLVLDSTYAGSSGTSQVIEQNWVKQYIRKKFQKYSTEDDYNAAKLLAKNLLGKIDTLIVWQKNWYAIDSMQHKLKECYTFFEYNPYNGKHDIEMKKKRKFYTKISSVLWPWLIEKLKNESNWQNLVELKTEIEKSYVNLTAFANDNDKTAKRIEKRVKQENDPENILKIILAYNN